MSNVLKEINGWTSIYEWITIIIVIIYLMALEQNNFWIANFWYSIP